MLSTTLRNGLSEYRIGERIRTLRLKRKMGLVELGKHTGLSPALLSKIERERVFPTLPTLLRIALVFSVDLAFFLAGSRDRPALAIVRRRDRLRFPEHTGRASIAYRFESLDFPATERPLNAYFAEFLPVDAEKRRAHQHTGVEFIYAISGVLAIDVGDASHTLAAGDAMYFDSSIPHGYRRLRGRCTAIVVTTA